MNANFVLTARFLGPDGNVYPITRFHIGQTAPPVKNNPLGEYTMEDADAGTTADAQPTRVEKSSTGEPVQAVNVVWDKGWLWDVHAMEPVFFPGVDNKDEINEVPAPLRRLMYQMQEQGVSAEDKQCIMDNYTKEVRPDAVLCTCAACNIRRYSNVAPNGWSNLPAKATQQVLSDRKANATSVQELRAIWTEMNMYEGEPYHLTALSDLAILQLDEEELAHYESLPDMYQPALSTHIHNDVRYHLHTEFVQKDQQGVSYAWICDRCHTAILNKVIPPISLAGGRDFGRPDRIEYVNTNGIKCMGLPPLGLLEMLMLCSVRAFGSLISLTTTSGSYSMKALVGHIICFPIDLLEKTGHIVIPRAEKALPKKIRHILPNLSGIPEIFRVTFLGPDSTFREKHLCPITGFIRFMNVSSEKVGLWCRAMKALAPDPELIEVNEVDLEARVQSMQQEVMSRIHIGEDPDDKALHDAVKSDVASQPLETDKDGNLILLGDSRFLMARVPEENENMMKVLTALKKINPIKKQERNEEGMDLDPHEQVHRSAGTDSEADQDSNAPSTPDSSDQDDTDGGRTLGTYTMNSDDNERNIHVKTGTSPLSMFAENRELWYGQYPQIFFLGRGLSSKKAKQKEEGGEDADPEFKVKEYRGPLQMEENLHLLYQANTMCAKNPFMVFHMFDFMSIASVLSQSAARVKQDPGSMDTILAMVNSINEDFSQLIARCEQNLHSAETKRVVDLVMKHMVIAGSTTPFSAMQRDETRGTLLAMAKSFGSSSTFITNAPDIDYNALMFRYSLPSYNNLQFPATMFFTSQSPDAVPSETAHELMYDMLRCGYETKTLALQYDRVGKRIIKIQPSDIYSAASENPVAAVSFFKLNQDAMIKHILCTPAQNSRRFTIPLTSRNKGIAGIPTVGSGVIEAQGRGALHGHNITKAGIPPKVLQFISECPALVHVAAGVLDSMQTAELDPDMHLTVIKRKSRNERAGYMGFTTSAPYVKRSKGDRDDISKAKAHEAVLRTKIMSDVQSEAPTLMWGILPFVSTALGMQHSDALLLSTAFHEVAPVESAVEEQNLADYSWEKLAQHMRESQDPAQRALLYEMQQELLAEPSRTALSTPLHDRMLVLFPDILAILQSKLKNFLNIKVVYGYKKGMGFRCRVSHIAAGGNFHDHKATCHNGPSGAYHCRMAIPNGLSVHTMAVQIFFNDKIKSGQNQQQWKYIPGYDPEASTPINPVLPAPPRLNTRSSAFFRSPISSVDKRMLYYENKRPKLPPLSNEDTDAIKNELQAYTRKTQTRETGAAPKTRLSTHELKILKEIEGWERRNGYLVCFNDCFQALVPGNQSINLLGSMVQSQLVSFYLASYFSKDRVAPAAIIPLISSAFRKIQKYPSTADNTGTFRRTTLHFLQKCTLSWAKHAEISAQQAAGAVLGLRSDWISERVKKIYIAAVINHVVKNLPKQKYPIDPFRDSRVPYQPGRAHSGSSEMQNLRSHSRASGAMDPDVPVPSTEILSANGKALILLQQDMFDHRGYPLESMDFIVYQCIIQAVKKNKKDGVGENVLGRSPNQTFPFHPDYVHAADYMQQVKNIQMFPMLIPFAPSAPPDMPSLLTHAWKRSASEFSEFVMTCFTPWNLKTGLPFSVSYDSCVQFLRYLNESTSIIDKTNLELIQNLTTSQTISQDIKKAHQSFHHRCSTIWTEEERRTHHAKEPAVDESKLTAKQLADLIDSLRAITGLDEKENEKSKAVSDFLFSSKQKFEMVMENHDSLPQPALPAPFTGKMRRKFNVIEPIPADKAQILYQAIRTKEFGDHSEDGTPSLGSKMFEERFRKMKKDPSKRPNSEQQGIIDKYIRYFDELLAFRANLPASTSDSRSPLSPPTPPLIFVHAEGGAGKSFIATFLQCAADAYGFGHLSTAIMGVACNNLGNAVTLDSILRPRRPCVKNKKESEENQGYANSHLPKLALLSPAVILKMQQQIKGRALLIIDELSVMGPGSLALLDEHVRDILNDQRPFGGMAVLILADFFQLSAFLSRSFITVMIRNYVTHADKRTDIELPEHQGCELLRLFTYAVLHINNRCKESDRLEGIRRLRDPFQKPPINRPVLNLLEVMTRQLIIAAPSFRFAPILVPGNHERCIWNYHQMFPYAKAYKKPIVAWRNTIIGIGLSHPFAVEPLYDNKECELWSYFIEGAPGFILFNYSVPLGCSNGVGIRYHGLSLGLQFTAVEIKSFQLEYAAAAPAEVIILPRPPFAVNIHKEVRDEDAHLWSKQNTILCDLQCKQKWVVLPLAESPFPVSFTVRMKVSLSYTAIRLTLAFAKTIHKCQSRTEDQVIFDCNQRPPGLMPLSLRGFFVAFTRVRQRSHLLIFPGDFTYLMKLQHDPQLVHWLAGFQEGKVWDVQAVIRSYIQDSTDHSKSAKKARTSYTERVKRAVASGTFTPAALLSQTAEAVKQKAKRLKVTPPGPGDYSMEDAADLLEPQKEDIENKSIGSYSLNDEENKKRARPPSTAATPGPAHVKLPSQIPIVPVLQLQYPHTLPNRGNTCFCGPPLLSLACIPEVVTALTSLRFEVNAHDFISTMGVYLQQLIPAIANKTVQPSCTIDPALLEVLDAFVTLATPRLDPEWRPRDMADAADIFRIILESFPTIRELFAFDVLETLSCECQKDEASVNRIYQYVCTPMLLINSNPENEAETVANQVLYTQNETNLAIDLHQNTEETARRRAHDGGLLCLRCLPGQQSPTGDFYLARKCPLHGPKTKKCTWETSASYYPVPKCFPSYDISIPSPDIEAPISYQILSQITEVESADSIRCPHCNQVGESTHRRIISSSPPRYLMVTIKQKQNTAADSAHQIPLIEFERLDLQALFSAQHAPSCFYSLHAAVIFQRKHYTLYLPGTDPACGMYINDESSSPATEATLDLVRRFARVLIYKKISPVTGGIPRTPTVSSQGKRRASSDPSTILISSALHREIKRIESIIRTDSLLSAVHDLFDNDLQTGGEYWANHIHAGSTPLMKLFDNDITADQLRKLIQVQDRGQGAWLNSELLDTILSTFLITKGSNLTVDVHRLQHKVRTHNNAQIRVFGCDFSKWICMHAEALTSQKLTRRLKNDSITIDEQLWFPAHIASRQTSTEQGLGNHYVVIKMNLGSRQITSSDSLRDTGSFAGSITWLANRMSRIPDLLLHTSKTRPASAWSFPLSLEPNHVEQINSSDCALHVIGDLAQTLFGIPLSLRMVQRLRQNLPIWLIAFYLTQGNLKGHSLHTPLNLQEITR